MTRRHTSALLVVLALMVAGCAQTVDGAPTWPGATLDRVLLTAGDFPPGVHYDRVPQSPVEGGGGPPAMLSNPQGCSDGLTRAIADTAERGPGSAAEYIASYNGARIVMTVLSWRLDLAKLAATAERCARFQAFFDPSTPGIPMVTEPLRSSRAGALVYQQTMRLNNEDSSVYFMFENVGRMAVFGIAFPTPNPTITVKGTLPQTFLDIAARQADRVSAA